MKPETIFRISFFAGLTLLFIVGGILLVNDAERINKENAESERFCTDLGYGFINGTMTYSPSCFQTDQETKIRTYYSIRYTEEGKYLVLR